MLQARYQIEPTSPGAILREQKLAEQNSEIEADAYSREGRLAPDALIVEVVSAWLAPRNGAPFIFDGFPRSIGQAAALEKLLAERRIPLDAAISLDASLEVIRDRVVRRRVLRRLREYRQRGPARRVRRVALPALRRYIERRGDDNAESLETRMREYREKSEPSSPIMRSEIF